MEWIQPELYDKADISIVVYGRGSVVSETLTGGVARVDKHFNVNVGADYMVIGGDISITVKVGAQV